MGRVGGGRRTGKSDVGADITALYFTLPQQWSGQYKTVQHSSAQECKAKYKSKISNAVRQYISVLWCVLCSATLQCSTTGQKVQCYITLHCYMGVYRYGAGGRWGGITRLGHGEGEGAGLWPVGKIQISPSRHILFNILMILKHSETNRQIKRRTILCDTSSPCETPWRWHFSLFV